MNHDLHLADEVGDVEGDDEDDWHPRAEPAARHLGDNTWIEHECDQVGQGD